VYKTAGKYLVKELQAEICVHLQHLSQHYHLKSVISDVADFVKALRTIMSCTSSGEEARKLMVKSCCINLRILQQNESFLASLRENIDLGAEIIGNQDLERALLGSWICSLERESDMKPTCENCGRPFNLDDLWDDRDDGSWWCKSCEGSFGPRYQNCHSWITWVQRGLI
jgi:hypothetical protein